MEFTKLELELIRYAMYDLLNADDTEKARLFNIKCERIIAKIDIMVDNLK